MAEDPVPTDNGSAQVGSGGNSPGGTGGTGGGGGDSSVVDNVLPAEPPYSQRRPINKGKLILLLTLIFVAVIIIGVVVVALRSGGSSGDSSGAAEEVLRLEGAERQDRDRIDQMEEELDGIKRERDREHLMKLQDAEGGGGTDTTTEEIPCNVDPLSEPEQMVDGGGGSYDPPTGLTREDIKQMFNEIMESKWQQESEEDRKRHLEAALKNPKLVVKALKEMPGQTDDGKRAIAEQLLEELEEHELITTPKTTSTTTTTSTTAATSEEDGSPTPKSLFDWGDDDDDEEDEETEKEIQEDGEDEDDEDDDFWGDDWANDDTTTSNPRKDPEIRMSAQKDTSSQNKRETAQKEMDQALSVLRGSSIHDFHYPAPEPEFVELLKRNGIIQITETDNGPTVTVNLKEMAAAGDFGTNGILTKKPKDENGNDEDEDEFEDQSGSVADAVQRESKDHAEPRPSGVNILNMLNRVLPEDPDPKSALGSPLEEKRPVVESVIKSGGLHDGSLSCGEDEYKCDDDSGCYTFDLHCDRMTYCNDASDERNCKCRDYLAASKRCDGYYDCKDGSDEDECGDCAKGRFQCKSHKKAGTDDPVDLCLPLAKECDNVNDCGDYSDEDKCLAIAPFHDPVTRGQPGSPYTQGLLYWKIDGEFEVLAVDSSDEADNTAYRLFRTVGEKACERLLPGFKGSATVEFRTFTGAGMLPTGSSVAVLQNPQLGYRDEVLLPGGRYQFQMVSPVKDVTQLVFVDCHAPKCGRRAKIPAKVITSVGKKKDKVDEEEEEQSELVRESKEKPGNDEKAEKEEKTEPKNEESEEEVVQVDDPSSLEKSDEETAEEEQEGAELTAEGAETQVRIVGGEDATAWNWPSVVGLYLDGIFSCGATIVDRNWVVTAAHCVAQFKEKKIKIQVQAGMLRRFSNSIHQYYRDVSEVHIYPKFFQAEKLLHDIALLRLDRPFYFGPYVSPICLPPDNDKDYEVAKGQKCFAVGWGKLDEGDMASTADNLQEVEIPVTNCRRTYNKETFQICGGYPKGGKDSCQGDSGGPFYCQSPSNPNEWYLGGIISHGMGCGRAEEPGVYTRVSKYLKWMKETMEKPRALDDNLFREPGEVDSKERTSVIAYQNCESTVNCDGRCLAKHQLCNFYVDCFNNHDEKYCETDRNGNRVYRPPVDDYPLRPTPAPTTTPHYPSHFDSHKEMVAWPLTNIKQQQCGPSHFSCASVHQCIPKSKVCDLHTDCVDHSDEKGCRCLDYIARLEKHMLCDGYPDCRDWEDERECNFCNDDEYYCEQSNMCVSKDKVCDGNYDCTMREDEKHCLNLFNGNSIWLKKDGRPRRPSHGYLAYNYKGQWSPMCATTWNDDTNKQVCQYMNYQGAESYQMVPTSVQPHIKNRVLRVRYDEKPIYPRPKRSLRHREMDKRSSNDDCYYVEMNCVDAPLCGVMPLYNLLDKEDVPTRGTGTFPWQITLFKNGKYMCGATLIHRYWIMTHDKCAFKARYIKHADTIMARAGGHKNQLSLSAHDQLKRVIHFEKVKGSSVVLGLLQDPFELNEYVNPVCIPSVTWVPLLAQCHITGIQGHWFNYAYKTQVIGVCDYEDNNNYKFCTRQTHPTNECMDNWSGALVCPDASGRHYAVGIFYSEKGNCEPSYDDPPTRFETIVSPEARDGIRKIIRGASSADRPSFDPEKACKTHLCTSGKCLEEDKVCDAFPDCEDFSDIYKADRCEDPVSVCRPFNYTHCECASDQLLCGNGMCISKVRFCDGHDDCKDGTDEPYGCRQSCKISLETLAPKKICDGYIDCAGKSDLGEDESAEHCCPVLKTQNPHLYGSGYGSSGGGGGSGGSDRYGQRPHTVRVDNGTIVVSNGTSYAASYATGTTLVVDGSSVYLFGGSVHGAPLGSQSHNIYSVAEIKATNRTHSAIVINSNNTNGGSSGGHQYGPVSVVVHGQVSYPNGTTHNTPGMAIATPDFNQQYYYRCVVGTIRSGSTFTSNIAVSNQCIGSKAVCDWDQVPNTRNCINGADELDCISIWPTYRDDDREAQRDVFGRYKTQARGFLHFVAYGRKHLYCAGPETWQPQYINEYGRILCRHEGFDRLEDIRLINPKKRTFVGYGTRLPLSKRSARDFKSCKLVYLSCAKSSYHH